MLEKEVEMNNAGVRSRLSLGFCAELVLFTNDLGLDVTPKDLSEGEEEIEKKKSSE